MYYLQLAKMDENIVFYYKENTLWNILYALLSSISSALNEAEQFNLNYLFRLQFSSGQYAYKIRQTFYHLQYSFIHFQFKFHFFKIPPVNRSFMALSTTFVYFLLSDEMICS